RGGSEPLPGGPFCRQSGKSPARPCPRHVSDGYAVWGSSVSEPRKQESNARWKFRTGRPVPWAGRRGGTAPCGPLGGGGRGGGARLGLAGRAPLRPLRHLPVGRDPGRPPARPHPPAAGRHGGQRAAHRPPRGPRRAGGAAAPHQRRPLLAGGGARRPLGRPEVFGSGLEAYEQGFPESLDLLMRWLREPRVGADGERFRFREVPVVPRPSESHTPGGGPQVDVACASPASVRLAAERGLPILLGMHVGDEEKAEMVALWRRHARASGRPAEEIQEAAHVSAGVCQIADRRSDAVETLTKAMPGWLRQGLEAHVTVDGRQRQMRDPLAYTELLCGLHPVGTPRLCADRLAATGERTGISRFALLVEGSGDLAATEENVR